MYRYAHCTLGTNIARSFFVNRRCLSTVRATSTICDFGLPKYNILQIPGITADPALRDFTLPKKCIGCGATFQTSNSSNPGYIRDSILRTSRARGRAKVARIRGIEVSEAPDGVQVDKHDSARFVTKKKRALCRRCYRLQYYKQVDHDNVSLIRAPETVAAGDCSHGSTLSEELVGPRASVSRAIASDSLLASAIGGQTSDVTLDKQAALVTTSAQLISSIAKKITNDSLVLFVLDLANVESSVIPELYIALCNRGLDVIWVANKLDILPAPYQASDIKRWLSDLVVHVGNAKSNNVHLVSSLNGVGFDSLERALGRFLSAKEQKNIYVVGAQNVGKSTLINRLLVQVGYSHAGTVMMRRGVGAATRSQVPGTTLSMLEFGLGQGIKLIDTPGIPVANQVTQMLTKHVDFVAVAMDKQLVPVTVQIKEGYTLVIGAMAYVELTQGTCINIRCNFGQGVSINVVKSGACTDSNINRSEKTSCDPNLNTKSDFDAVNPEFPTSNTVATKVGKKFYPPNDPQDYPRLKPQVNYRLQVDLGGRSACKDLVISGLGWMALGGQGPQILNVKAPKGVHVFFRPSIPCGGYLKVDMGINSPSWVHKKLTKRIIKLRKSNMGANRTESDA